MKNKIWYREGSFTTNPHLFKFFASICFAGVLSSFGFFGISVITFVVVGVLILVGYLSLEHAWYLEDIEIDINSILIDTFRMTQSIRKNPIVSIDQDGFPKSIAVEGSIYHSDQHEMHRTGYGADIYLTIVYLSDKKHLAIVTEGSRALLFETLEVQ